MQASSQNMQQTLEETCLVQMTLKSMVTIEPLDKKPHSLLLQYHVWLRQELTELERTGTILLSIPILHVQPSLFLKRPLHI